MDEGSASGTVTGASVAATSGGVAVGVAVNGGKGVRVKVGRRVSPTTCLEIERAVGLRNVQASVKRNKARINVSGSILEIRREASVLFQLFMADALITSIYHHLIAAW